MISEEINEGLFAKPSALYVRTTAEKFDIKSAATEAAAKGNTSCQSRPTGRWRDRQLERRRAAVRFFNTAQAPCSNEYCGDCSARSISHIHDW
jgi:hypothetical protein